MIQEYCVEVGVNTQWNAVFNEANHNSPNVTLNTHFGVQYQLRAVMGKIMCSSGFNEGNFNHRKSCTNILCATRRIRMHLPSPVFAIITVDQGGRNTATFSMEVFVISDGCKLQYKQDIIDGFTITL